MAATQLPPLREHRLIPRPPPELLEDQAWPRRRRFWRTGPRPRLCCGWSRGLAPAQLALRGAPPRLRTPLRRRPEHTPAAAPLPTAGGCSLHAPAPTPSRAAARPTSPLGAHDALLLQHEGGPVHQARHHGHAQAERHGGGARAARPLPGRRRRCSRCSPHSARARPPRLRARPPGLEAGAGSAAQSHWGTGDRGSAGAGWSPGSGRG